MGPQPQALRLPPVLDLQAAEPLARAFAGLRGQALRLDASGVERLGGLCLQVLLSARAAWSADGARFEVADRSAAFDDALALFGAAIDAPTEARA